MTEAVTKKPTRGRRQDGRRPRRRRGRAPREKDEFEQNLVEVRRVSRMQAGGRRFSFRCFVVVGDRKGRVGIGVGKGKDVSAGVEKAVRRAKENLFVVPLVDDTIPFALEATYQTSHVLLKPAAKGRGVIAGGVVRIICDLAGIPNVTGKILARTKNKINTARATMKVLEMIRSLAQMKGVALQEGSALDAKQQKKNKQQDE